MPFDASRGSQSFEDLPYVFQFPPTLQLSFIRLPLCFSCSSSCLLPSARAQYATEPTSPRSKAISARCGVKWMFGPPPRLFPSLFPSLSFSFSLSLSHSLSLSPSFSFSNLPVLLYERSLVRPRASLLVSRDRRPDHAARDMRQTRSGRRSDPRIRSFRRARGMWSRQSEATARKHKRPDAPAEQASIGPPVPPRAPRAPLPRYTRRASGLT